MLIVALAVIAIGIFSLVGSLGLSFWIAVIAVAVVVVVVIAMVS